MMYISTDYVFDGQGQTPWKPDCKEYAPLNVYGETKLAGELAVAEFASRFFIVRIAWVFGLNGNNFIKTMLKVGKTHDTLTVVDDQIGTPTYTYDLARLLVDMIQTDKYGYYHATNEGGYISWYDFAREIFAQAAALGHEEYDGSAFDGKAGDNGQNMERRKQQDRLTADWIRVSLPSRDLHCSQPGRMR